MKKFIAKLSILGGLYLGMVCLFLVMSAQENWSTPIEVLTKSEEFAYGNFGAREIVPYIERVQEKNDYTKLVIGDSVCNQIFNRYYEQNDIYCICGSNQAISLAGQYILAEEFVQNHEEVTDIYLVIIMDSLTTDFGAQLGYQYAVMPFVETDTIDNLDADTRREMYDMYGWFFCQKPIVELIDKSPLNTKLYLNFMYKKEKVFPHKREGLISGVAYRHLEKMHSLCEEKGINLHLTPGPHADLKEQHKMEEVMRRELAANGDPLGMKAYFDSITYYPEELFRDRVHFDEKKLSDDFFKELAKSILPEIEVE